MNLKRAFSLCVVVGACALVPTGCATTAAQSTRATTRTSVLVAGGIIAELEAASTAIFVQRTNDLVAQLSDHGGSADDYARLAAPLEAEFRRRGDAIQSLDACVYASAAILDATANGDASAYLAAVAPILDAIARAVTVLRRGDVLPAVPIPSAVVTLTQALRSVVGGHAP